MTKSGGSKHQKRIASPRNWVLPRKKHKFAFRADPGPHSKEKSVPIGILLRDVLKLAETAHELKFILNKHYVKVDGRVVTNPKFPVGLMDVIQIDQINKSFRLLPHYLHVLAPYEIKKGPRNQKACQILNKTTIKGGQLQLNLHDGRNILLPKEEGIEQKYMTKDTIVIELPSQKILAHYPFKEGKYAFIIAGRNVGKAGTITEFQWRFGPRASTVKIVSSDGVEVQTTPEYVFVVGDKAPFWEEAKGGADK
ncbi:MAG: 30S ribosomal protein S4e [Candidatus Heimdallarchaeota archaeon]|nr:30S ribosomal protein S4e [Candidatus Heimdallarchaeota archaeon]